MNLLRAGLIWAAAVWLPAAVGLTVAAGLAYAVMQQVERQGADGPAVQMAEDAQARLEVGAAPADLVTTPPVDVAGSLAPFVIVYDDAGAVRASGAALAVAPLLLPPGVLDTVRRTGEWRGTWAPISAVRLAVVVRRVGGVAAPGFVLAGSGLREVEARIDRIGALVAAGWLAGLLALALAALPLGWLLGGRKT